MAFWKKSLQCFRSVGFEKSAADPCLCFAWKTHGLVLWLSWMDDCLVCGNETDACKAKEDMKQRFDCDDKSKMKECIGCKVERGDGWLRLTQPVLLNTFEDEFELPDNDPKFPATAGKVLVKGSEETTMSSQEQFKCRSGVGKLLHMMRWTRPDVLNLTRDQSRHMMNPPKARMSPCHP